MLPSSVCYECKLAAGIKCLHCSHDFCRVHFREHEETISNVIHPLVDRLNKLTEQNVSTNEHKTSLINKLDEWRQTSYRTIDDYYQLKYHEIEENMEKYKKDYQEKIQQIKNQIQPFISNDFHFITNEQSQLLERKLIELENTIKVTLPSFQFNLINIDSQLVALSNKSSISSLLDLKIPKRSCQIKFDAPPMITNGKYILLQDTTNTLGLYDCHNLSLYRQIAWSSTGLSTIIDLHYSHRLEQFLVLTREYIYVLNNKNFICNDVLQRISSKDFRTMTTDDDHDECFIATSTSIEQYSLSTWKFSKRYNMTEQNIYSLRFNSTTNQFGLTVRTCTDHKWYFELRDRSMIRLWSILTPIEHGSCLASVLINHNQWIIVNIHGDVLFQITNDGHVKAEIIYGGRSLLNAIESKNMLIMRTYGRLEQYEL